MNPIKYKVVTPMVGEGIDPSIPATTNNMNISFQFVKELGKPINLFMIKETSKDSDKAPNAIHEGRYRCLNTDGESISVKVICWCKFAINEPRKTPGKPL